jgi:hypothetical protein
MGKGKKQMVQVRQGRVNFTTLSELPEGAPIMMGTFSINHQPMIILLILVLPIVLSVQNVEQK